MPSVAFPLAVPCLIWVADATSDSGAQQAYDLVERLFGHAALGHFDLALADGLCAPGVKAPCFALSDGDGGGVVVRATAVSELTYGIGYYLRFRCNMTLGWPRGGGSSAVLPATWARVGATVALRRAVPWTYLDNVCTHSYSYPWYDESAWMQHLDWMAVSGINVFLALTGQEEVQYKVFREFGLGDSDIRSFFNGPAYLTWSRGQSMQGVGSPLPRSWMQSQWRLQRRILGRARGLGMIGVLPAFQGNMPPQVRRLYPSANISAGDCAWVASTDPLFGRVAGTWMRTLIADFGTQHWYQCDGFFTGLKPPWLATEQGHTGEPSRMLRARRESAATAETKCRWSAATPDAFLPGCSLQCKAFQALDAAKAACEAEASCGGVTGAPSGNFQLRSGSLAEASPSGETSWLLESPLDCHPVVADQQWAPVWRGAWAGMARTDPEARWLYQGWAIRGWSDRAGAARILALYQTVPRGQWIPLDMDVGGIWRYFGNYSFFGAPFIWTTLHNMGGNDGLKGDMRLLARIPSDALEANASIAGTGASPEGIDQNPAYYEYTFDTAWHAKPVPLKQWFAEYPARRYGAVHTAGTAEAWTLLASSVYSSEAGGWHDDTGVEWNPAGSGPPAAPSMDVRSVYKAWQLLVEAAPGGVDLKRQAPLNYDIVNVGREVLAQLITAMVRNVSAAVACRDKAGALAVGSRLLDAYADLDELVGCDRAFLIGPWIAAARSWANASDAPAEYYEWQARSQVSTWWPLDEGARKNPATYRQLPKLDGYANKHWNGLIRDFYAPRVQAYLEQVAVDLPAGPLNKTNLTAAVVSAELHFTLGHGGQYATEAAEGSVAVSRRLITKYARYFEDHPRQVLLV